MRPFVWHQAAKRFEVVEKGLFKFAGVFTERLAGLINAADDLVLDISDIHHVADVEAAKGEVAPDNVGEDKRAEVPDVRVVVHGRAAAVEPDFFTVGIQRHERFDRAGEGVENIQAHKAATA